MPRPTRTLLGLVAVMVLCTACGEAATRSPAGAQRTYGAPVDASDARPGRAIAAEPDRYAGRRITVEGRITSVRDDGCRIALDGNRPSTLYIDAPRSASGCAWTVPAGTEGIAAATGTLRTAGDSLRLSANGMQVTPVRLKTKGL